MNHDNAVLVFLEFGSDKAVLPVSLECVTAGRKLADALRGRLLGLIMGSSVGESADEVRHFGLDRLYTVDCPLLGVYHPETYCPALLKAYEESKPNVILMGETLTSADLAPRVAFALNTGLITDCVGFEMGQSEVCFIKPVYSSNVMAAYALTTKPYLVTMRSRTEDPAQRRDDEGAEVIALAVEFGESALKMEVLERVLDEQEGPRLASSSIIVSGGRGVGGPEGFALLRELAKVLNAAVGASRPPVDLGWVPPKAQVGQTGEKVGPSLYVAIGISGATQHLAGMSDSKTIVAINKDPMANIFKVADYGVVGNHEQVVPAFTDALKEILR